MSEETTFDKITRLNKVCTPLGIPRQPMEEYIAPFYQYPYWTGISGCLIDGMVSDLLGPATPFLLSGGQGTWGISFKIGDPKGSNSVAYLNALAALEEVGNVEATIYRHNKKWCLDIDGSRGPGCFVSISYWQPDVVFVLGILAMAKINREWDYYKNNP